MPKKPIQLPQSTVISDSGLPPAPPSPNAPPLPAIVKPSKVNTEFPVLNPELTAFYPSLNEAIDIGVENEWIGQGVINDRGEWVPSPSPTEKPSLFNIEHEEDILTRYWYYYL